MAEKNGELPKGWKRVKLGDVCKATSNKDPRNNTEQQFYYVDITSVNNVSKRIVEPKLLFGKDAPSRARQLIFANDVVLSTTRPNLNAVALVPSELDNQICSTGFCVLRSESSLVDANYLFVFTQSVEFVNNLSNLVKGALYPAVTDKQVKDQLIPLPPLPEQKRIVAILNEQMATVEKARAAAEAQLQAAKTLPAAYLREVFDSPEAQKWKRKPLGEFVISYRNGLGRRPSGIEKGYIVLRIADVSSGVINIDSPRYIEMSENEIQTYSLIEDDVIFIRVNGSSHLVGRCIIVDTYSEKLSFNDHLIRVRLKDGLNPKYLKLVCETSIVRNVIEEKASTSAGQLTINQDILSGLQIPFPSINEQRQIIIELEEKMLAGQQLQRSLQAQLNTIKQLPAALLRQAFNGEL